jgi:hypothetical protein
LEFFNSCAQESEKNSIAIRGGASSASKSSCANIDGKTYAKLEVSDNGEGYYMDMVDGKVTKKSGKVPVDYKLGGQYSVSYEVKGYGAVSYSCEVG